MCVLRFMDQSKIDRLPDPPRRHTASDLPRTKFSDYLEDRVQKRILECRQKYAEEENLNLEDVEMPGEINIRVVSCKDTELIPRQGLEKLYRGPPTNYPNSFPYRVKCVLMFERIDGVDILIYAMYTQSYGSESPKPNRRCLYIAYLDTVFYFTPRFLRTPCYHELLIATIAYEKVRGITKVFIWACPPLAGDDYILYCHPKEQKLPRAEMLRNWYLRLLEDARKEGIVISVDNLYDSYLKRLPNPCTIPNLDGDYWPGVTEQFIEQFEQEKTDPKSIAPRSKRAHSRAKNSLKKADKAKTSKKASTHKKKSKKSKYKKKSARNGGKDGTDRNDEGHDVVNRFMPPPPQPSRELPQQDALTVKIGEVINQMKEDFIVVRLHHVCAECSCDIDEPESVVWVPKDWCPADYDLDFKKKRYTPPYALCDPCYTAAYVTAYGKEPQKIVETMDDMKKVQERREELKKSKGRKSPGHVKIESTSEVLKQESHPLNMNEENKISNGGDAEGNEQGFSDDAHQPVLMKKETDNALSGEQIIKTEDEGDNHEVKVKDESIAESSDVDMKDEPPPPPPEDIDEDGDTRASFLKQDTDDEITILPEGVEAKFPKSWLEPPCELTEMKLINTGIPKETTDPDPPMDCQFFDTRQQFLSLCQGNKYQFDQLRRAKHSSMMVLYHLHNPELPSFVHSCNNCRMDITTGNRYTCEQCEDFDLCETCKSKVNHKHELKCVSVTADASVADKQARRLRQQHIQLHMQLLEHASSCQKAQCDHPQYGVNCAKMKALLRHGKSCKVRLNGGCRICRRIWALLQIHARQCPYPAGRCKVPRCSDLKDHLRKLNAKQQDRRIRQQNLRMQAERQAMNAANNEANNSDNQAAAPSPQAQPVYPPEQMHQKHAMISKHSQNRQIGKF